jgi:hypothetical protein
MKTKIISTILLLNLTACTNKNPAPKYLACYALEPLAKQKCTAKLARKYIPTNLQKDSEYTKNFQFKQEKLGFKQFLQQAGKTCNNINDGPEFDPKEDAYLVKCDEQNQYYLVFDYEGERWRGKLIE